MAKRKSVFTLLLLLTFSTALGVIGMGPKSAMAQSGGSYSLTWSTIDSGGSTSTGGAYALAGTIGQPDAGTQSGGGYHLTGGFWFSLGSFKVHLPVLLR